MEKRKEFSMMKLISWNVNGLRACVEKGFTDVVKEMDADIFCVQETKMQAGQLTLELPGYYQYFNYAEKRGIPAQRYLPKENRCRCFMESAQRNMTKREELLRWSLRNFIL